MRLKAIRKQVREKTREAARVNKEEIQRMETQLHAMSPGMHSRWMEVKNVVNEKKARAALKGIQVSSTAGGYSIFGTWSVNVHKRKRF